MYNQIGALIKKVPQRDRIFVIGDFNFKVGNLDVNYPIAIGKHTTGEHNARGEFLAELCTRKQTHNLKYSILKKKHYTWTSPDGKTKNQIDFILTRQPSPRQTVLDSAALNVPDISDHRMVRAKARISFSWPERKEVPPK